MSADAVYVYHSRISFRPPLAGEFCVLVIIYDILWSLARLYEGRALIVTLEGCFAGREKHLGLLTGMGGVIIIRDS